MDKQCQHHNHGGSFMNGFLMGAIIGAAVVFFLFTEKGKKLLQTIIEEGSEGFSELREFIEEEMDEEDFMDDAVERVSPEEMYTKHADPTEEKPQTIPHVLVSEAITASPHRVKRFFKRTK